ncbi:membrane protein [Cellvibrio zantedeschiae]|uniref:Membrane protein n=1 Tax=Cellvibrio zantedeschiae TaxID=1237077 RepID=A0ABQ3AVW4_9GAMM|nr:DMT family transporter [Cellvibrio zantedeschiae]GGY69570.1 membrane protein [Cellvibrio zantedeschiae]
MLKVINQSPINCVHISPLDFARLGLLAAIWGASFIAMRASVPELGTLLATIGRVSLAAIALVLFSHLNKIPLQWKRHYRAYFLAGLFGAALPFALFSYAAHYLPAALSALLNATCPLFGALFSMLWLAEKLSARKLIGLLLGLAGVWMLVGARSLFANNPTSLSLIACLLGPACFAISGVVIKYYSCSKKENRIEPLAMATGSMVAASLILLPALPFSLPAQFPSYPAIGLVAALALFPSAFAQIIFIPLVARIGPTRAMSVSFLIPLFSMIWGFLFLDEVIGISCVLGGFAVLAATGLVVKTD